MKNTLTDLNNYLFESIERLNDIEINIPMEQYNKANIEFITNPDGEINVLIKT